MKTSYHLHINIFHTSEILLDKLKIIGYQDEPFLYMEDSYAPPIHYSFEHDEYEVIEEYWEKALRVLAADCEFRGYIERETLVGGFLVKYQEDFKFNKGIPFPLPMLKFVPVPIKKHKKSDLHVKRTWDLPNDELDSLLMACGFYLVRTDRHKLYTIQSESAQDMIIIFNLLKDYFNKTGGVKALTLEFISHLVRFPNNFEIVNFLPKNYMLKISDSNGFC